MSRRAFTLIELLVVVAIVATMVSVSVVGLRAGQGAARIRGATRDIVASIRQARSRALVMMQPAVVTYSTTRVDDEICAQISVDGASMTSPYKGTDVVETLSGEKIQRNGEAVPERTAKTGEETESHLSEGEGQTVEDMLFAPLAIDVVKGVRIKVTKGDELLARSEAERKGSPISVFSNVDYLLGRFREQKAAEAKAREEVAETSAAPTDADEDQEPVSVVWEANGRCDPHRVWVYLDGSKPESGLCIKVDRFGATKVVSADEEI